MSVLLLVVVFVFVFDLYFFFFFFSIGSVISLRLVPPLVSVSSVHQSRMGGEDVSIYAQILKSKVEGWFQGVKSILQRLGSRIKPSLHLSRLFCVVLFVLLLLLPFLTVFSLLLMYYSLFS